MKKIVLLLLLGFVYCNNAEKRAFNKDYTQTHREALTFCKANNFNENYYFLLDLSLASGKNRFFVYDFNEKKVTDKNLVTHGSCDKFDDNPNKWEKAKFSNATNSHCSMKGKYRIGKRDYSGWGIHVKYWLHGLEKTNANAVNRVVVLHSWDAVSNEEIYPNVSPLSWGCPAVSDDFMKKLDAKLQQSKGSVLLWIVE